MNIYKIYEKISGGEYKCMLYEEIYLFSILV